MNDLLGPLLALAAALLFGAGDFAGGALSRRLPSAAVVGVSQALNLVVLLAILPFVDRPADLAWAGWSVAAGLAGAGGLVLFYRALSVGTVGVVSPIAATGAIIPVALAFAAGERPGTATTWGIAIALAGAVLASGPELRGEPHVKAQAVWLAAGAAVCFGVAIYGVARGAGSSTAYTLTGMRAASVTCFAVAALVTRGFGGVRARDLPALAGVGLADGGANALFATATTLGLLSVSTVLTSLYPVVTVLLAAWLWRERMRPVQIAGVALALSGVGLIAAG